MPDQYNIVKKWGLPRKMVSCPGCSSIYGHHKTKVCTTCQECSKCCTCSEQEKDLITAEEFITEIT